MQPSYVPAQPTPAPKRSKLRPLGLAGLVIGLVAGGVTWFLAGQRYDDAVADLAPAPVGCATTLEFDSSGTYTFFLETKGSVDELDGDCAAGGGDFEFEGDGLPRVSLTLLDGSGDEVDLDRVDSPTYDAGGASGQAIRTADIDDPGEYTLTVDANAEDVVVRVGRDPSDGVSTMRAVAIALGVLGLLCGVLALVAGRSRRPAAPAVTGAPSPVVDWQPNPVAPTGPPAATQPGSPPYQWGPTTPAPPRQQPPQPGWPPTHGGGQSGGGPSGGGQGGRPLPPPGS